MEQISPKQMNELLRAPETSELLKILQQQDGVSLKQAVAAAKNGDSEKVKDLLASVFSNKKAEYLAKTLTEKLE